MFPTIKWAQRKENVLVSIFVDNCKDVAIDFSEKAFTFKGKDSKGEAKYDVTVDLDHEIKPDASRWINRGRCVEIVLGKKDDAVWWTKLTPTKRNYISVDFNKWRDESDDEDDDMGEFGGNQIDFNQLAQMQAAMEGNGMDDMDVAGDSDSSDDEKGLPEVD